MTALITNKPVLGYIFASGGMVSGLLTFLHVLTPLVGFIGAVFGMVAGFIHLRIKLREWRKGK